MRCPCYGDVFMLTWNEKIRRGVDYIHKKFLNLEGLKTISSVLFVFMITFYTWLFTFSPVKGIFAGNDTLTMVWSGGSNLLVDLNAVHPIIKYQGSTGNNFLLLPSGYFQWWMFGILGLAAGFGTQGRLEKVVDWHGFSGGVYR